MSHHIHLETARLRERELARAARDRAAARRLRARRSRSEVLKISLAALGALQLGLGIFMLAAPGDFHSLIGPYGERNDHYTRDAGTFTVALGVTLGIAAWRPAWRVIALIGALVQYGLHSLNHLIDIEGTDPEVLGFLNFFLLLAGFAALGWLLALAIRDDGVAAARPEKSSSTPPITGPGRKESP